MEIIEYNNRFKEDVKDLLVELQEYVVSIDKFNLNIVSEKYRDGYFDSVYEDIINGNGKIFLCIDNDKAIGMVAGHIRSYNKTDKLDYKCPMMGVVEELIVSKSVRQSGVGGKLLATMENYFNNKKCEYIMLDVFAYNDIARQFYINKKYEERMITLIKKI